MIDFLQTLRGTPVKVFFLTLASVLIHFLVYFLIRSDEVFLLSGLIFFSIYLFICYGIYWVFTIKEKPVNRWLRFLVWFPLLLLVSFFGGLLFLSLSISIPDFSNERSFFSLLYRRSYWFIYFSATLLPFIGYYFFIPDGK